MPRERGGRFHFTTRKEYEQMPRKLLKAQMALLSILTLVGIMMLVPGLIYEDYFGLAIIGGIFTLIGVLSYLGYWSRTR